MKLKKKKMDKLLQSKTKRNKVIKIKEEMIDDELYHENQNEEKNSTRESKKSSWEEDKKYKKRLQQDLHKDLNENTYDINIENNTAGNNSVETINGVPLQKNIEVNSNTIVDEEKETNSPKENNEEVTTPMESEQEQCQSAKCDQNQNSENSNNNQDQEPAEKYSNNKKYDKTLNKKRSLLSKKLTKHKKNRRKYQESSYSPSIYNSNTGYRVSQSMVNYNQEKDIEEEEEENGKGSEEDLNDAQVEKERLEREKLREKQREKVKKSKRESTFKYYFDGHVVNNKKVRWEVKIKQLTGWFSIGVAERQKTSKTNEKQNPITMNVDKQFIINKINFLMTNDHCTIIWIGNKNQINQSKGVFAIKQGDILTFTFCPKFNQLKIQKNNNTYLIDKINYYGEQWLVPCAIYSRKNDKALFRNFHVLADYNK